MPLPAPFSFFWSQLRRLVVTPYDPEPGFDGFLARAQTQSNDRASVTVAVLSGPEAQRLFGVPVNRRGIQPVFVRVENLSADGLRLQVVSLDPSYFTPLEAAALCHFSIVKRLSTFGIVGWLFVPMVLFLVPLKLLTAWLNNSRMDDFFRARGFRLTPIEPGARAEGFVFTTLDAGTKAVHVRLAPLAGIRESLAVDLTAVDGDRTSPTLLRPGTNVVDFHFTVPVPGIAADYLHVDFDTLVPPASVVPCTPAELVARLEALPAATTNAAGTNTGDPVNLVVIGTFDTLLAAFAARWDDSETISLATCWKTVKAFLLGVNYRYSPVSSLHLFGRSQDVALQRARHTINERLHLRLWLTNLAFDGRPVWVGQVSRDIGVRLTTKAWNLTTHRIDPDVDEARDYCLEDLAQAQRVEAAGYVGGVGASTHDSPKHNLTGDPYHTDGRRVVILLSPTRLPTPE
jgi:hypothetical protein